MSGPSKHPIKLNILIKELKTYNLEFSLQRISAYLLLPELQTRNLRVELLLRLAAGNCRGKKRPSFETVELWLNEYIGKTPIVDYESPVDDLFVDCIHTISGSFKVLTGIHPEEAFWVNRLLRLFYEKGTPDFIERELENSIALLKIANLQLDRLKLLRYETSSDDSYKEPVIVDRCTIVESAESARFGNDDLQNLEIDPAKISRFILNGSDINSLSFATLWTSNFEKKPILKTTEGWLIVNPAGIAKAVKGQLQSLLSFLGGFGHDLFSIRNAELVLNKIMGINLIYESSFKLPNKLSFLPPIFPFLAELSPELPLLLISHTPDFDSGFDKTRFYDNLVSWIRDVTRRYEAKTAIDHGIILVNFGCSEAKFEPPIDDIPVKWGVLYASTRDWEILLETPKFDVSSIFNLSRQIKSIAARNGRIINGSGLINLAAFWRAHQYCLLPDNVAPQREDWGFVILPDFASKIRNEYAKTRDIHFKMFHLTKKLVQLRKYEESVADYENVYASLDLVEQSRLVAVVYTAANLDIWIEVEYEQRIREIKDWVYQLWNCLIHWLNRFFYHFEPRIACKTRDSVYVVAKFDHEDSIVSERNWDKKPPSESILYEIDQENKSVKLRLNGGFLSMLSQPENTGERALLSSVVAGIAKLEGIYLEEKDATISKCFPNYRVRLMHSIRSKAPETLVRHQFFRYPRFIRKDFLGNVDLRISELVSEEYRGKRIISSKAINEISKNIVTTLLKELEEFLAKFSHFSLIQFVLLELDSIYREQSRWELTSSAKLEIEGESAGREEIADKKLELDACALSCRIIVEISQYTSIREGNRYSEYHHHYALSYAERIIQYSSVSDCAHHGLVADGLTVDPCGIPDLRHGWMEQLLKPYRDKTIDKEITKNKESYADYFGRNESKHENVDITELDNAIEDYYGLKLDSIFHFADFLCFSTVKTGSTFRLVSRDEALAIICQICGCSVSAADKFFSQLILPVRKDYKSFPEESEVHGSEILPWRFRRSYSLLRKPIVRVNSEIEQFVVSATLMDKFLKYCIPGIHKGYFLSGQFSSSVMKDYLIKAERERGEAFEVETEETLRELGLSTMLNRQMKAIAGKQNSQLGEVDIIAYSKDPEIIYLIECKHLLPAGNVHDVIQQLNRFTGEGNEDELRKHFDRIDWFVNHRSKLVSYINDSLTDPIIVSLVVTNRSVPMEFSTESNKFNTKFVSIDELDDFILSGKSSTKFEI